MTVAVVAILGWDTAIARADPQASKAAEAQAAAEEAPGLRQKVANLQQDLETSRTREQAL